MDDDSQLLIPPSFVALYLAPGRSKPSLPRAALFERFEWCEELSQILVEQATGIRHELGIAPEDVLERVHRGLLAAPSPVTEGEAAWVTGRLAEHLGWEPALAALGLVPASDGRRAG